MITTEQAAAALKEANIAEKRSRAAYSYSQSAPYCFVWGAIWFVGYGVEAFLSFVHRAAVWVGWWWMGLTIAGAAISVLIRHGQASRQGQPAWRVGALFPIIWLYILANFLVLHPRSDQQIGASIPLLFAAIYAAIGLWLGLRYILIGIFMAAATLGAYFLLREYFFLWMALVGGGSMILTGLWLQRA